MNRRATSAWTNPVPTTHHYRYLMSVSNSPTTAHAAGRTAASPAASAAGGACCLDGRWSAARCAYGNGLGAQAGDFAARQDGGRTLCGAVGGGSGLERVRAQQATAPRNEAGIESVAHDLPVTPARADSRAHQLALITMSAVDGIAGAAASACGCGFQSRDGRRRPSRTSTASIR